MRWLSMIATLFVFAAATIGVLTLAAFGYDLSETLGILVPLAIGVAVLVAGVTFFGRWSVRKLNEDVEVSDSEEEVKGE